jgi:hypothetical protein
MRDEEEGAQNKACHMHPCCSICQPVEVRFVNVVVYRTRDAASGGIASGYEWILGAVSAFVD